MKTTIGTVQNIEGTFYAKDSSGNIIELHAGDRISSDMIVYGDKANDSSAKIGIKMIGLHEVVNLEGSAKQLFDMSLMSDALESEAIKSATASAWLKSNFPFKNARSVNSPGLANLIPFLIKSCIISC